MAYLSPERVMSRAVRINPPRVCNSPDRTSLFAPTPTTESCLSEHEHAPEDAPLPRTMAPGGSPRRAQVGSELRKPPTPRRQRLNVRENRKEAIATSSTLDFVALSACDEDDVAQCDDTHTQTEALKRSRTPPTTTRPVAAKCQRTLQLGVPSSPHLSSEGGPSSELGNFEINQLPVTERKDPWRPQSSRGDGSRTGDSLILSSSSDNVSPSLTGANHPFVVPRSRSLVSGTRCPTGARPPSSRYKELAGFAIAMESSHSFRPPSSLLGGRDCPSRAGFPTPKSNPTPKPNPTNPNPNPNPNPGPDPDPDPIQALQARHVQASPPSACPCRVRVARSPRARSPACPASRPAWRAEARRKLRPMRPTPSSHTAHWSSAPRPNGRPCAR